MVEGIPGPFVVFAGGGTGGHLYPMVGVAREIHARWPNARLAFFTTQREIDRRVITSAFLDLRPAVELVAQEVRPMPRGIRGWPGFLTSWRVSVRSCLRRFTLDRPDLVIGSGGYGCAPPIRAAARIRIPRVLLNPDVIPGLANRRLATQVDGIFVQWPAARDRFPAGTTVHVTGCPIRPEFNLASRETGRRRFGLDPSMRTVLVTGASQGARSVNRAVVAILNRLEAISGWQYLHLTGPDDMTFVQEAYRRRKVHANVIAYTDFMPDALAAADLVVSRAGASTLAEITALGVPSVLMPYPHHRDAHQTANAGALVDAGAAVMVEDRVEPEANAGPLADVLTRLMEDHDAREEMGARSVRLGRPDAAAEIVTRAMGLAGFATVADGDRPRNSGLAADWRESGSRVDDRDGAVASGPMPGYDA